LLEVASEQIGAQPTRRGDSLAWETLLDPETVQATMLARADRVDQAGADEIRDLQRLRNTFAGMANTAKALIDQSLPSHQGRAVAV
jgi:hypothetical protein